MIRILAAVVILSGGCRQSADLVSALPSRSSIIVLDTPPDIWDDVSIDPICHFPRWPAFGWMGEQGSVMVLNTAARRNGLTYVRSLEIARNQRSLLSDPDGDLELAIRPEFTLDPEWVTISYRLVYKGVLVDESTETVFARSSLIFTRLGGDRRTTIIICLGEIKPEAH